MNIEFTKEQYKELIMTVIIGTYIREAVAESQDAEWQHLSKLEEYILSKAKDFELEDMVEKFKGSWIPNEQTVGPMTEEILEIYNNDEFWERLETELGKRDFWKTVNPEEKSEIEANGWLPERIQQFYQKYRDEFDQHELDRLEIKSK